MNKYQPPKIEPRWQRVWEKEKIYSPDLENAKKPFYNLMMFPYPSAEGLHVGNMYAFTGSDIYGRFKRMQGFDVFEPIGLDGFGIHSENYALKVGRHPKEQAKISEKNFYRQLRATGNAFDWTRKLQTYDSNYYKWTQWIFIQLYKKGLAYRAKAPVNFCPQDKTVLADEQVIDGRCERCGTVVEKRELEQWFFKITAYADRLLENIEKLDWSERVKIAQRQWIGRSEGARIEFKVQPFDFAQGKSAKFKVEVFTTRPDTLYGATFLVLAPEHPISVSVKSKEVQDYISRVKRKPEQERLAEGEEKTGIFSGLHAINPVNNEKVPVWIADYAVTGYGTGALFGDAHDERDVEFAKKYGITLKPTLITGDKERDKRIINLEECFTGYGTLIDSGEFSGMSSEEAKKKITSWLKEHNAGGPEITYHLRDWLISRQRYWGPPIPMINCAKCGWQPVPECDLPVLLPNVRDWKPKGAGESPLASVASFARTSCPNCQGEARRETDVSDTFLDSAWYFLRYLSTEIGDRVWDRKRADKWLPVDMYIGGAEHAVLHLLYTRFLSMVFYDLGLIDFSAKGGLADEPFAKFRAHGLLISGGAKMSKSRGNVVVPDAYIDKYGADTLRCYLMFCGRFTQGGDFQDTGIEGMHRFLKRVWRLVAELSRTDTQNDAEALGVVPSQVRRSSAPSEADTRLMHKTIKRVTEDIESLDYNTAISALMIWLNALEARTTDKKQLTTNKKIKSDESRFLTKSSGQLSIVEYEVFLKLLAPFAPHMTEELWERLQTTDYRLQSKRAVDSRQSTESIHQQPWPSYDPKLAAAKTITLVVQVNGRVRDKLPVEAGISQKNAEQLALNSPRVQKYLGNKKPRKIIFVPDRLINLVI